MLDDIDSIIEETRLKARKERLERERLHLEVAAAKREEEKRERKRRIQNAQEAAAAEADVGGANEQVNSKKPVPLRPMSYSGLKATKRKRTVGKLSIAEALERFYAISYTACRKRSVLFTLYQSDEYR